MPDTDSFSAIIAAVRAIPAGCVASYGEVARRAGLPRRARLVGRVLRETPDGVVLPWHRVVRADGRIAFPVGSEQHAEQCRRLKAEGVLLRQGRVPREQMERLPVDLDEALWG